MILRPSRSSSPEFSPVLVTKRSDQFLLALTFCQLLSGKCPFRDRLALSKGQLELDFLDVPTRAVVRKATAVGPMDRYVSCVAMVTALEKAW